MIRSMVTASSAALTLFSVALAQQPITYVDAGAILPDPLVNGDMGSPTGNTTFGAIDETRNGEWLVRDFGVGGNLLQASNSSTFGELTTTLSGLTPGTEYDVYAFFWSAGGNNWFIDGSLSGPQSDDASFTNGSRNAVDNALGPVFEAAALSLANPGAINGTNPLPLSRSTPGITNTIDIQLGIGGADADNNVSESAGPGDQDLYAVNIGSTIASGAGEISAYIRNIAGADRVWYDGLGYAIFDNITLTIDVGSGAATLSSRSSLPVEIGAYEITSDAGSLNTSWNGLRDDIAGWDANTGTNNSLAEASDLGSAPGSVANPLTLNQGDSFDLGNIFFPGADADLTFDYLQTSTSTVRRGEIRYVLGGDYNDDGVVDAADYTVWRDNEGAAAGALPNDLDGGVIGQAQYDTWVANFGASLPAIGASAIPEPTAAVLMLASCVLVLAPSRSR